MNDLRPSPGRPRWGNPGTLAIALGVVLLGFLPTAQWVLRLRAGNAWRHSADEWASGSAITIGVALALAIASRTFPGLWREGAGSRAASAADERGGWVAVGAALLYAVIARAVFSARPLMIDEVLQHFQAIIFAQGRLALPSAPHPEFFTAIHVVEHEGRTFTHFPPGWPAMLALGVLAGVPWLVGPLCGGVTVLAWWWFLRGSESRPGVRGGALLLLALAPFTAFLTASQMNHAPTLMWLVVATAALTHGMRSEHPRPWLAVLAGFALGAAATIRPVDAFAFAVPAAAWYLGRAIREPRRWIDALAAGAGVAVPMAWLLWFNARTTGAPLVFGYELLWGSSHGLGFHADPYGGMHTPRRGLAMISSYLVRLQSYLYEWPVPSLLPPVLALALWPRGRRLPAGDRYLLASGGLLLALYAAYWFDGLYLGPRFVFALVPLASLWTARLPALVREHAGPGLALRTTMYAFGVAVLLGAALNLPFRVRQYARGISTERWDAERAAATAGVHDALVLVRESWGSQVIARLWGLGITRSQTETIYRRTDTCLLEQAVTAMEMAGLRGPAAWARLAPLMKDSARIMRSTLSPDGTERVLPGTPYPPACVRHILDDRAGYTHYPPLLNARFGGNAYARTLGARDTLMLAAFPGRPVYLLTGTPEREGRWRPPRFFAADRDSILAAAREASR